MFYVPWSMISSILHCISGALVIIILHTCSDTKMPQLFKYGTVTYRRYIVVCAIFVKDLEVVGNICSSRVHTYLYTGRTYNRRLKVFKRGCHAET